jgi:chemotaxis protein CheZ
MEQHATRPEHYLDRARALVVALERRSSSEADRILDDLTRLRERELFQELGKLTRSLHEALNSFRLDSKIAALAERDIPDARERLRYVITKTEQAANRTLKAVEDSIPVAKLLETQAREHKEQWERFLRREMQVSEFRRMARTLGEFLEQVIANAASLHGNLSEVMIAQDYQDLTGQVIHRVIDLVQEIEASLVELIRVAGHRLQAAEAQAPRNKTACEGPQIHTQGRSDVVASQDEVDSLLASLGF